MALLPSPSPRRAIHRRTLEVDVFRRDDGLYDVEARLVDTKPHPIDLIRGPVAPGEPIHDLRLRVTVDAGLTVVDAAASGEALPVPGACDAVHPDYRRLVGLNLMRSFRREVKVRMAGTRGCTHLSELAGVLPTAALQSIPYDLQPEPDPTSPEPPFFIGQCHAYDRSGETVRRHYPQWFVRADSTEREQPR